MKNKGLSVLISLFAVFILSVSFFVPVFAQNIQSYEENFSGSVPSFGVNTSGINIVDDIDLVTDVIDETLYKVDFSFVISFDTDKNTYPGMFYCEYGDVLIWARQFPDINSWGYSHSYTVFSSFYAYGSDLYNNNMYLNGGIVTDVSGDIYYDSTITFNIISCTSVSSSDTSDYESGYNAGYSAGEEAGYTSGYSSGFEAGADSIDQDAIYDQGFQAGVDSVDTQSYYDAGYQAGYAAAYDAGYSSGYNVGYDDAMAAIESWGADGNIYPSLIFDWTRNSEFTVTCNARSQYPGTAFGSINLYNGFDLSDPNHVYKVEFNFVDQGIDFDDYSYSGFKRVFIIGDKEFAFTYNDGSFFIDGNDFSSDFLIGVYAYYARASSTDTPSGGCQFGFDDFNVKIYDYGFKDNMQNIIANQTNDLTTGYDAGSITESNTSLSGSLTQYDQAEAEITGQSVGFIDGVEFYDPASNVQLLTCITFCSSFLQSLFVNLGDWGILPMISLSLALGLMLVGWFKYRK